MTFRRCMVRYCMPFPFGVVVLTALVIGLVRPEGALAATHIGSTTYTSSTTWTAAGSPYVLDGAVTVASGATLTVDPGVIVKFNGQTRWLVVNGTLIADGTQANPITFTSYQDDSAGGDTNGDGGATSGAPGQWYMIWVNSTNSLTSFDWVNVRYGAWGTGGNYGYGALKVTSTATVSIDHSTFSHNQKSGLLVGSGGTSYPGAVIGHSNFANNGNGISVNNAWIDVGENTQVQDNDQDGIFFNLTSGSNGYSGPESTVTNSDVKSNSRFGFNLQLAAAISSSYFPIAHEDNIYDNDQGTGDEQLHWVWLRLDVESWWTGNYWGEVEYQANDPLCLSRPTYSPGHLAYTNDLSTPPAGPITWSYYTVQIDGDPPITIDCPYDMLRMVGQNTISSTYIDNSGL